MSLQIVWYYNALKRTHIHTRPIKQQILICNQMELTQIQNTLFLYSNKNEIIPPVFLWAFMNLSFYCK